MHKHVNQSLLDIDSIVKTFSGTYRVRWCNAHDQLCPANILEREGYDAWLGNECNDLH